MEDIVEALDAVVPHESLYAQTNDDGGYVLDTIADKTSSEDAINDKILVKDMLQSLDKRSRQVIILVTLRKRHSSRLQKNLGFPKFRFPESKKRFYSPCASKSADVHPLPKSKKRVASCLK